MQAVLVLNVKPIGQGSLLPRQHREERADDLVDIAAVQLIDYERPVKAAQQNSWNENHRSATDRLITPDDVLRTPNLRNP